MSNCSRKVNSSLVPVMRSNSFVVTSSPNCVSSVLTTNVRNSVVCASICSENSTAFSSRVSCALACACHVRTCARGVWWWPYLENGEGEGEVGNEVGEEDAEVGDGAD